MARDTLSAVVAAKSVARTLVVCSRAEDLDLFSGSGVDVLVAPALGLNSAIGAAAMHERDACPGANLAVLPADLPYLTSAELDVALEAASGVDRACVPDHSANGTTLLTARAGATLLPRYGADSLRMHRSTGAIVLELPGRSGLRCDVDVPADLRPFNAKGTSE